MFDYLINCIVFVCVWRPRKPYIMFVFFKDIEKEARDLFLPIPHLRLSQSLSLKISNAEAHADDIYLKVYTQQMDADYCYIAE